MTYDPFERGEYPVGVRTIELTSEEPRSGRKMTVEVWSPATEEFKGIDTNEATFDRFTVAPGLPEMTQEAVRDARIAPGKTPLILYFHGAYGYRRELAHVCTHLASRGYLVAAPDFPGDNIADLKLGAATSDDEKIDTPVDASATNRPSQASFVLDCLLSDSELAPFIDADKIGTFGQSMGGFTSLRLNSVDARPSACVPIAPLYGQNDWVPQLGRIQGQLRVDDWNRPVSTLLLSGELDTFVLLPYMRELAEKLRAPKRLAILRNAGHFHWSAGGEQGHEIFRQSYLSGNIADKEVDGRAMGEAMRPFSELAPAWHAADTARALCLAHFDENLKGNRDAQAFLDNAPAETFAGRGIDLEMAGDKTETVGV
jgi:dienelactone hydrolase